MDWKEFIAALIGSLAWPIVIIVALFLLKKPLLKLLPDIQRLKYGDLELEFADKIKALKSEVDANFDMSSLSLDPISEFIIKFTKMANSDPRKTILEASKAVDGALIGSAIKHEVPAPLVKGVFEGVVALQNLEDKGVIGKEISNLFSRLLDIRGMEFGQAAKDKDLALDFVFTAAQLMAYLRASDVSIS